MEYFLFMEIMFYCFLGNVVKKCGFVCFLQYELVIIIKDLIKFHDDLEEYFQGLNDHIVRLLEALMQIIIITKVVIIPIFCVFYSFFIENCS